MKAEWLRPTIFFLTDLSLRSDLDKKLEHMVKQEQLSMLNSWDITDIKKKLAEFHDRGAISEDVVRLLVSNGFCAPVESEIFDYKETIDSTPQATAKLIRHIVSFYNSFGGYLLFGVEETISESVFRVIGFPTDAIDLESLKAKLREYVGERIQISGTSVSAVTDGKSPANLFLLFIPKRPDNGRQPVHFVKDAPGQVFRKDDVYYRVGDECVEAKGPRLFALTLPRPNPYLSNQENWDLYKLITKRIENNLPDRNSICPHFVGRDDCLDVLWRWLCDDLSHVKMLAGEGGLGKTSIAYEFANKVSQTVNIPFEQVVWLTAKRRQFVGQQDDYVLVPETHYSTYVELLRAIIEHLPLLIDKQDLESMTVEELRRQVKDGLSLYPSFLIVDDIDSLNGEQQRQVFELGFLFGALKSKLLLTTRHNLSYSHDSAITVGGFDESEFLEYLSTLQERHVLQRALTPSETRVLHELTGGSPLYTESVCRLLRFQSFNDAVKGWGKDAGAQVRAAALEREISMLAPESKRILLTAAMLTESSVPEIAEITEYPQETVLRAIHELSSLFLLAGETLGDLPRFSVPENTVRLVLERESVLVTDHKRLRDRITQYRTGSNSPKARDRRVGNAVAQAQALLRLGDIAGALSTVDDAKKLLKGKYDLLGFRAEILMRFDPPKYEEARRNAREAFQKQCRRPSMYFAWFEAEWLANHFVGAEEVARAAIENSVPGNGEWWVRLAAALVSRAEDQKVESVVDKKISTFFEASSALATAIQSVRGSDGKQWEKIQFDIHDRVWKLLRGTLTDLNGIDMAVQALEKIWGLGDYRVTNANRSLAVAEAICSYLESPFIKKSEALIHATDLRLQRCQTLLLRRREKYPEDSRQSVLDKSLDSVRTRFSNVLTTH